MNKNKFNKLTAITSSITLTLILTACGGEFSYKRGASVQDLQSQKNECADENKTDEAVNQCLKDNGWIVLDGESEDSLLPRKLNTVDTTYHKSSHDQFAVEEAEVAPVNEPEPEVTDPLERIKINSWWKMGAGGEQLLAEGADCLATLGDGYYANGNMSEVSLGVAFCMEDKGWRVMLPK